MSRGLEARRPDAKAPGMRSLWTLLLLCLMATSLVATSMAHAGESVKCVDSGSTLEIGHVDGDADQVPADPDKDSPHHHSSCHNHQVAPESETGAPRVLGIAQGRPVPANAYALTAASVDPALRPPQA